MQTINDVSTSLHPQSDGSLVVFRQQELTDDFLSNLRSERLAARHIREGEYMKVCSIPNALFDLWHAQGRDPWRADAREIVKWLRDDGLEAFMATSKAV